MNVAKWTIHGYDTCMNSNLFIIEPYPGGLLTLHAAVCIDSSILYSPVNGHQLCPVSLTGTVCLVPGHSVGPQLVTGVQIRLVA